MRVRRLRDDGGWDRVTVRHAAYEAGEPDTPFVRDSKELTRHGLPFVMDFGEIHIHMSDDQARALRDALIWSCGLPSADAVGLE